MFAGTEQCLWLHSYQVGILRPCTVQYYSYVVETEIQVIEQWAYYLPHIFVDTGNGPE